MTPVALFKNVFAKAPQEMPLAEILAGIKEGQWQADIEALRELLGSDRDRYSKAKRFLPAFCISGTATSRADAQVHSNLLQIDFDHLDGQLQVVREKLRQDPHVAFGFVSPSGTGLKLGLAVDGARHADSFTAAKAYFHTTYGLDIDPIVRDRLRLCFVSWDPEAWTRDDSVTLPLPEESPTPEAEPLPSAEQAGAPATSEEPALLEANLRCIPADAYDDWVKVGMALKSWDPERGLTLWRSWSRSSTKFIEGECEQKWATFNHASCAGAPVTIATIFKLANEHRASPPPVDLQGRSLIAYADLQIDPSATLLGDRFLCRGGALLFIGPSGIGKSSAGVQQDILWSIGRPAFGIAPAKPLRILSIQGENDEGDVIEMVQGVLSGLNLSPDEKGRARDNTVLLTCRHLTGALFVANLLRPALERHHPDLVRIDPLLQYVGCDVVDQEGVTRFIRTSLGPLLDQYQCGLVLASHTPKTTNRDTSKWGATDWQYGAAGTADLTNWSRAVLIVDPTAEPGTFRFIGAKRGNRLGWRRADGALPWVRYFRHSCRDGRIFWEDADETFTSRANRRAPTADDLLPLVPEDGYIPKTVLIERAKSLAPAHRIGRDRALAFLDEALQKGQLHVWRIPRPRTNPLVAISRQPQPEVTPS